MPDRDRDGPRRDRLHVVPPPNDIDTDSVAGPVRRRQEAAQRMLPLPCGCTDPLPCDLARWCPYWDGLRPEPVQRWQCPGQFGANGRWQPCCTEPEAAND